MLPESGGAPRPNRPDTREALFRDFLVKALKSPPPSGVQVRDFAVACGVGPEVAIKVAEDLYRVFARKVAADGIITPQERAKLDGLAATLEVEPGRTSAIEQGANDEVYRVAVGEVLADGIVTPEEAEHLARLRDSLGIEPDNAGEGPAHSAAHSSVELAPRSAAPPSPDGTGAGARGEASPSPDPDRPGPRRPWFVVSMNDGGIRYDRVGIRGQDGPHGPILSLVDSSAEEVLEAIRDRRRAVLGPRSAAAAGSLFAGAAVLAAILGWWGVSLGLIVLGSLAVPWVAWRVEVSGTVRIFYDADGVGRNLKDGVVQLFEAWSRVGATWVVGSRATTHDLRRNAGAGTLLSRSRLRPGFGAPPGVVTNARIGRLDDGRTTAYFLPDRVLVSDPAETRGLPYEGLGVAHGATRFVESDPAPGDALVVDTTWQFVNKDGSPDRRFNGNRQLPVMHYGELDLDCGPGARWRLQTSRVDAAEGIASMIGVMGRGSSFLNGVRPTRVVMEVPTGFDLPTGRSPLRKAASALSLGWARVLPDWLQPIVCGLAVAVPFVVLAVFLFGPRPVPQETPPANPAAEAAAPVLPDTPAIVADGQDASPPGGGRPADILGEAQPDVRLRAEDIRLASPSGPPSPPPVAHASGGVGGMAGASAGFLCGATLDAGGTCRNRVSSAGAHCHLHSPAVSSGSGIHVGPRGGIYHYSKSGNKVYHKRR